MVSVEENVSNWTRCSDVSNDAEGIRGELEIMETAYAIRM